MTLFLKVADTIIAIIGVVIGPIISSRILSSQIIKLAARILNTGCTTSVDCGSLLLAAFTGRKKRPRPKGVLEKSVTGYYRIMKNFPIL